MPFEIVEDLVGRRVEVVVDDVRFGHEEAFVAGKNIVDLIARAREEDVAAGRNEEPEVTRATAFLLLYEDAGGVDAAT